jgi:hypothetical protein
MQTHKCAERSVSLTEQHIIHRWTRSASKHKKCLLENQTAYSACAYLRQALQDGLWQSIQDNLLEQTGHSLQEDVLPTHFMQQILAPGILSQQALSHALLDLEEPLTRYNASIPEVQQHLTAAAQVSKSPNAPSLCVSIACKLFAGQDCISGSMAEG